MNERMIKYGIPVQALAIFATLGCEGAQDPMVGDFVCGFFAFEGEIEECPSSVTEQDNGYTYEVYYALELSFTDLGDGRGSGTMTDILEMRIDGEYDEELSRVTPYDLTGTQVGEGVWDIVVPDWDGLQMRCTADLTGATCEGTDDLGALWEFNWVPVGGTDEIL